MNMKTPAVQDPAHDDLADVIIPKGSRISDNPSDWIMDDGLSRRWSDCPDKTSIMGWWEALVASKGSLHGRYTPEQVGQIVVLIQQFDAAQENSGADIKGRTTLRGCFVGLFAFGLTFTQAASICNLDLDTALAVILRGRYEGPATVEVRLEAERLLRSGMTRLQVAEQTGMSAGQVTSWAQALQIPMTSIASLGYPSEMRQAVFDMTDQGMSMTDVRHELAKQWPAYPIKRVTASSWISRRRRGVYDTAKKRTA